MRAGALALALLAPALPGLNGCAGLPAAEPAPPVYDLSEERASPGTAAPPVFLLEKDGVTLAVFGTVHLVPEAMKWLSPAAEAALARADLILTETSLFRHDEVRLSRAQSAMLAERSMLPPGRTLWDEAARRLGPDATMRIRAALAANDLSPGAYAPMRPWLLCRDLEIPPRQRRVVTAEDRETIKALADAHGMPDLGPPDLKIEAYGVSNGIDTGFLESEFTRAHNFSLLGDGDALDCAAQHAARAAAPRFGARVAADYSRLLDMWSNGEIEKTRAMVENDQRALNGAWSYLFLQAREKAWTTRIAADCAAARRNCFVAVGVGHLGGTDGLLRRIEALGYRRIAPQG